MRVHYPGRIRREEGRKPKNPEKTLGARTRINNKLNAHMTPGPGNRSLATAAGGERSHHCANRAPIGKKGINEKGN